MTAIETSPLSELLEDRQESIQDIKVCEIAMAIGITSHADGMPVRERRDINRNIVQLIDAELDRRGYQSNGAPKAERECAEWIE